MSAKLLLTSIRPPAYYLFFTIFGLSNKLSTEEFRF